MTETRQAPMTPSGIFHPILDDVVSTTKNWWLLLVAGVAWIVIAVVILRFDYATVADNRHAFRILLLPGGGE